MRSIDTCIKGISYTFCLENIGSYQVYFLHMQWGDSGNHDDVMPWECFPHYWPTGVFPSQRVSNMGLLKSPLMSPLL